MDPGYEAHRTEFLLVLQQLLSTTFPGVHLSGIFRVPAPDPKKPLFDPPQAQLDSVPHYGYSSALGHRFSRYADPVIASQPHDPHQLILPYDTPAHHVAVSTRGLLFFPGVQLTWKTYQILLSALRQAGILSPAWHKEILRHGHVAVAWPEIAAPESLELPAIHPIAQSYLDRKGENAHQAAVRQNHAERQTAALRGDLAELTLVRERERKDYLESRKRNSELLDRIEQLETELTTLRAAARLTEATQWSG